MSTLQGQVDRRRLIPAHGNSGATAGEDLREPGQSRRYYRVGATSGVLGVVFLMLGTALHPVPIDGNDAAAAFAVYAEVGRSVWLAAHLLPLAGITGMVLAVVLLSRAVSTTGTGRLWARLTEVTGAVAIAVTAVLQAVDSKRTLVDWGDPGAPTSGPCPTSPHSAVSPRGAGSPAARRKHGRCRRVGGEGQDDPRTHPSRRTA